MDLRLLHKYGGNVPRYTSYPTAAQFDESVGKEAHSWWLWKIKEDQPVSLYFHVPYCDKMCWYCACHTNVTKDKTKVTRYRGLLEKEIGVAAKNLRAKLKVSHIHWGGGSPNLLSVADFNSLMGKLGEHFIITKDVENAMEIDPRSLTRVRAKGYVKAGLNRVSLGVQDFNPKVQEAINRVQPFEMTKDIVSWFRDEGIRSINFDLMYGLPLQTVETVLHNVELASQLNPDRLAVFGYAHVPWMKSHQRMIRETGLPSPQVRLEMAEAIASRLQEKGYVRIGLDHFAKPDDPMAKALKEGWLRRNFQGYTTDQSKVLLGFGASSISQFPGGFAQNFAHMKDYREALKKGDLATARGVLVTDEDRLHWAVIEQLMCYQKVDLERICADFKVRVDTFAHELDDLRPMAQDGLVTRTGNRIEITKSGRPFMRTVCAVFDQHLFHNGGRHSKAV